MNLLQKALGTMGLVRTKDITVEGGIDLLSKVTAGSLSKTAMLNKYNKSLYVFACVSKIAEKVSSIELEMFKVKNSKGDTEQIYDSEALDLLYKCNPFQTHSEFWEITVINLKCTGDAFWYKVRNDRGQVVELWNLRPDLVTIVTDSVKFVRGYEMNSVDGKKVYFPSEDVVHFRSPDPLSPYFGTSPLRAASTRVETEDYANRYQRDFFLNSARPDAIIKTAGSLDKEQRDEIREGWEARYKGPGKGSKVAVLYGGLEYQLISLSQKEMDFIESQKITRDDILVAFGMPKSVLGIVEDVNRANAETSYAVFLTETVVPTVKKIVEKVNEEMIYPDFGEDIYLDFIDPTPKNREEQRQELDTFVNRGILLVNEAREILGYEPIRGGWSMYLPMTMVPVGGLSSTDKMAKAGGETRAEAYERLAPVKKFNFRGRGKLKKILEIKETLKADIEKRVRAEIKAKQFKKKALTVERKVSGTPYIQGEELKFAYANMILKKIDMKAEGFKSAVSTYAEEQEARVLKNMDKVKGKTGKKKAEITIDAIFDETKEVELAIEMITPEIRNAAETGAQDAIDMLAPQEDMDVTVTMERFIKARSKFLAESMNSTTIQGLEKTLAEGLAEGEGIVELRKRVKEVYSEFSTYRTELIARTEATAANNEGLVEGFRQSGVATGKEWINAGDPRVRDEHKDGIGVGGEIVPLDGAFTNGLKYPSEPNCRCVLGPAFIE